MQTKKSISVKELSELINVHKTTLYYWLCNYNLAKYVENYNFNTFGEKRYLLTKESIKALRMYLFGKNTKYLLYFDSRFPKWDSKKASKKNKS